MAETPTPQHIDMLLSRPDLAVQFDEVYGPGAAARTLAAQAPAQPAVPPEEDGERGVLADAASAVVSGPADALEAIGDLVTDVADSLGLPAGISVDSDGVSLLSRDELDQAGGDVLFGTSDSQDAAENIGVGRPQTIAGEIVNGITQFATGYATGSVALSGVLKGAGAVTKAATTGAVGDFIAFDEHEARLSNLIQSVPSLQNPVTEYLQASPEDGYAEGRLKNALEGLGIGAGLASLTKIIPAYKKAAVAAQAGDQEAAEKVLREAQPEIDAAVRQADEVPINQAADDADEIVEDIAATRSGPETTDEVLDSLVRPKELSSEDILEMSQRVLRGDGNLEDVAEAFNINRWASPDEGKEVVNEMVDLLRESHPEEFTETQSLETVARLAGDLLIDPDVLWRNIRQSAEDSSDLPAQIVAMKVSLDTTTDQLPRMVAKYMSLQEVGDEAGTAAQKAQIEVAMNLLADRLVVAKGLQKNVARALGAGRVSSQAVDTSKATPDALVDIFKSAEGDFDAAMRKIAALDGKPNAVLRFMDNVMTFRTWDVANEFFINSILSGPKTHVVNMLSNTVETLLRPLERAAGSALRADPKGIKADLATYAGMVHGSKDAARMAFAALRQERNILDPTHAVNELNPHHAIAIKDELNPLAKPINTLGKVIRIPSRFLASEDEFFKQINYRAKVYSDAYRRALDKGLDGRAANKEASDAVLTSTDAKSGVGLDQGALDYARVTTFTNDLEYGFGKGVQDIVGRFPALRQIVPFVRTPTNLIRQGLFNRTPIGFATKAVRDRILGRGVSKTEQSEAIAQMVMGSSIATWAASLAIDGVLTGKAPEDPNLRRAWFDAGNQPYSVRVGDQFFSYERGDPRFMAFGIAADAVAIMDKLDTESAADVAAATVLSLGHMMTNKSYTRGIGDFLEAIESGDPETMSRYMRNQTGPRIIPFSALLNNLNPDDVVRENRELMDGIMRRLPGFSTQVEPRRNALGEPIIKTATMLYGLPIAVSRLKDSEVNQKLAQFGENFGLPPKKMTGLPIDLTTYRNRRGQTAWDRLQELTGTTRIGRWTLRERLEREVSKESFKRLPDLDGVTDITSGQARRMMSIINQYRSRATRKLYQEYPDLLADIKTAKRNRARVPRRGENALQDLINQ